MQDFVTIATSLLIAARMGQVYVQSLLGPGAVAARTSSWRGAEGGRRLAGR